MWLSRAVLSGKQGPLGLQSAADVCVWVKPWKEQGRGAWSLTGVLEITLLISNMLLHTELQTS